MASTMTRRLASITLAVLLTAPSSVGVAIAQAKQECSATKPSNLQGHWWSYRLIDGRKCWYEGKPGFSKSLLEWPKEASAQPASGGRIASPTPERPHTPSGSQTRASNSQTWASNSPAWTSNMQAWAPTDSDTFETRWRSRAAVETRALPEEAASAPDAGQVTPEVDDVPSLRKTDRLQLPYFESRQAKSSRTLVINPDSPHPAAQ
jgi:hypothetical protein